VFVELAIVTGYKVLVSGDTFTKRKVDYYIFNHIMVVLGDIVTFTEVLTIYCR
jgi:hypothetical protein